MSLRRRSALLGALLLSWPGVVACRDAPRNGNPAISREFAAAVEATANGAPPAALTAATAFDWDRVVVVCPYDDAAVLEQRLGFPWSDFPGADDSEGYALFVFANGTKVLDWTRFPRSNGDPCSSSVPRVLEREQARFSVTKDGAPGNPFYVLAPVDGNG